jgi:Transposase, Mutator family
MRGLTARGLAGVRLVISDAHRGLVDAIAAALSGVAWQRCRTHYLRTLLTKVPRSAQPWVATMVRTIFDQPDAASVRDQHGRVVGAVEARFPDSATHLDDAREDLLAFSVFPHEIWRQIWSNNPIERLNKEIRRRTDVVGIFPDRAAIIRLVGAVPAEQTDEWTEQRRYLGVELLTKARLNLVDGDTPTDTTDPHLRWAVLCPPTEVAGNAQQWRPSRRRRHSRVNHSGRDAVESCGADSAFMSRRSMVDRDHAVDIGPVLHGDRVRDTRRTLSSSAIRSFLRRP